MRLKTKLRWSSYLLDPQVRLQLVAKTSIPNIFDNFSDVFLYSPSLSESLRTGIEKEQNYKIEPVYKRLWRLEKQ